MKKIWNMLLELKRKREYDDGIRMFAKSEYKQDSEFAYHWMKENPNKVLCYWDVR